MSWSVRVRTWRYVGLDTATLNPDRFLHTAVQYSTVQCSTLLPGTDWINQTSKQKLAPKCSYSLPTQRHNHVTEGTPYHPPMVVMDLLPDALAVPDVDAKGAVGPHGAVGVLPTPTDAPSKQNLNISAGFMRRLPFGDKGKSFRPSGAPPNEPNPPFTYSPHQLTSLFYPGSSCWGAKGAEGCALAPQPSGTETQSGSG